MTKITHINFAKGFRGGERQTLLLLQELSKEGYEQTLLTRKKSQLALYAKGIKNLSIIPVAKPYAFSIHHVKDATLLHAHETKAAQFAYLAHLVFKTPYIITRRVDNPIKKNFFNRLIYQTSNHTVVLSNAIKHETNKVANNINIEIIPSAYSQLPIDFSRVETIKKRFDGKFLLGNIGELDNGHKGQYYLIEAMKKLAQTHPDIHLLLLGKGKDEAAYKIQAKELNNITFEGFVENVADYIQVLDLFVFPSLHEGLGSILFDVMQAKVPIIATDTGGIPDIIENKKNGLLVPIKDSEAIYQAILSLYHDSAKRQALAEASYENIDNFSAKNMALRYIKLYQKSLS